MIFPTLMLFQSKSKFSVEKDMIKLSGYKAIKGIPMSKEPLYGERGHTNGVPFDKVWEKKVTVIEEGKEKSQIKFQLIP